MLCELMSASGDFLVQRVREEVLPALLAHVERALHEWPQLVRTRRARASRHGEWTAHGNRHAVRVELHALRLRRARRVSLRRHVRLRLWPAGTRYQTPCGCGFLHESSAPLLAGVTGVWLLDL